MAITMMNEMLKPAGDEAYVTAEQVARIMGCTLEEAQKRIADSRKPEGCGVLRKGTTIRE